jgi:hypothetical protein
MLLFCSKEFLRSSRVIPLYKASDSILLISVLNAAGTLSETIFLVIAVGLIIRLRSIKLVFDPLALLRFPSLLFI